MSVLGLDLATHTSGYSVLNSEDLSIIDKGYIDAEGDDLRDRVKDIYFKVNQLILIHRPELIVMEDVPINPYVNIRVGKDLSILHGAILGLCFQYNIKYKTYAPNSWRSLAGTYDGTRAGMKRQAQKEKAIQLVKDLYGKALGDDIAEAILIARVGATNE